MNEYGKGKTKTPASFSQDKLNQFDIYLKMVERMQTFQLIFLYAVMLDGGSGVTLSPLTPDCNVVPNLSVQIFKLSARLSRLLSVLRRQNVMSSLKRELVPQLSEKLENLFFSKDPTLLFGGQVRKVPNIIAKLKVK